MNHRLILSAAAWLIFTVPAVPAKDESAVSTGRLDAVSPSGVPLGCCPLKHTEVDAELSGTLARVSVTQQFHNPFREKIEAVYVFPLHQDSAVDAMTMTVGDRVVKGVIKERGEARRIYTEAKAKGKVASLLDQERPNIFTQAVANIEPGQQVTITIRYSQTLAVQYVLTHDDAGKSAGRFYERIDAPVLTDVRLDFGGLAVEEVYPEQPEDLFACQPVVVKGRYSRAGEGVIRLTGRNAAGAWQRDLTVTLPAENSANSVLAPQWARAKVEHLTGFYTASVRNLDRVPPTHDYLWQ